MKRRMCDDNQNSSGTVIYGDCYEKNKSGFIMDLANYVALVLILIGFYYFVVARVALVADVYFIPVNYPTSEATAVHISLIGVGLYVLVDDLMIIVGFLKKSLPES